MTFTPINRGKTTAPAGFSATPPDSVRLSTYRPRPGGKILLVIWLGDYVASAIGLSDRREMVEILADDSGDCRRVAIRRGEHGDFFAAKKLRAYSVHLDAFASHALIGDEFMCRTIGPEGLHIESEMIAFEMPKPCAEGQRL